MVLSFRHMLGKPPIPWSGRGLFRSKTWRMHWAGKHLRVGRKRTVTTIHGIDASDGYIDLYLEAGLPGDLAAS